MSEQLAQSSIEIHRAVSTKDKAAEYSWSVKLYSGVGADRAIGLHQLGHDWMCGELARIDAKLRELFPQADQVKALGDAYQRGYNDGLAAEPGTTPL